MTAPASIFTDLDWAAGPRRPWWLPRRNLVMLASQFLHGERVAQAACERLLAAMPDTPLRRRLAGQAVDEARHAQAYGHYLERLGDIAPARPALARAFDHIADWRGPPVGLVLATHLILESEALAIQLRLVTALPCPLFGEICRRAARDEARHLAIGRALIAAGGLREMPQPERLGLYVALRRFWADCTTAAAEDHGAILAWKLPRDAMRGAWERVRGRLAGVGLLAAGETEMFAALDRGRRVISVIIPTLDEADRLPALLARLSRERACEIVVSDGGSGDSTVAVASAAGATVVIGPAGRGGQLARGVAVATGETVLLLHADSVFPPGGLDAIAATLAAHPESPGGNFRLLFDGADRFSRRLERFYAWMRRRGLYYGDSGIFIRRTVLETIGGIRPLALMEDYDLVRRLERTGPTLCIADPPLTTSSRRFAHRSGRAIVLGWLRMHLLHALGVPAERLATLYGSRR